MDSLASSCCREALHEVTYGWAIAELRVFSDACQSELSPRLEGRGATGRRGKCRGRESEPSAPKSTMQPSKKILKEDFFGTKTSFWASVLV